MKHVHFSIISVAVLIWSVGLSSCQRENPTGPVHSDANLLSLAKRPPSVPAELVVPGGNEVTFHAYARGVQIYQVQLTSTGYAWVFIAPEAALYAAPIYNGVVGSHYAGPTWESNSGSKVVGRRIAGATVDPNAIPWLLLQMVSTSGSGPFASVTYIQRVNTAGGRAPTTGADADHLGLEARVDYTAEYYFYSATE